MSEVQVRKASSDDVEAARALTNRSWLATYAPLIGEEVTKTIIDTRHATSLFAEQAANPDHTFLVATQERAIVGHCYACPKDGTYIDRLHVEPSLKGGGIGRAMLDHVEGSQGRGDRIWLEVLDGNDSAIGFYQRVGFALTGKTDACGGLAGIPALVYSKTLTQEPQY